MSDRSRIEWTDATWNPVRGCTKVSPGCKHCYAETFAERFRGVPGHPFEQGFDLRLVPEKLQEPLRWRSPRKVFVNSMSDLFHEQVTPDYIAGVGEVMRAANWHVFQVLTKRAERLAELSGRLPWSPNIWMGVSIGCQRTAYKTGLLARTGAAVKWISAEPLLERVEMDLTDIDWMVIGGESGPRSRPMDPEWARHLLQQCRAAGTVPFVKQMGSRWARARYGSRWMSEDYKGKRIETWDGDLRVRDYPRIASPAAAPALPRLRRIRPDVARAAARKAWETRRARAALAMQSSASNTKPST